MTSLTDAQKDSFLDQLSVHYENRAEGGQPYKMRSKAWDQFQELGLPSKHMEVYRYVKLRKLYSQAFSLPEKKEILKEAIAGHVLPGYEKGVIVLVNGFFYPELSDVGGFSGKIVSLPIQEAFKTYGAFLNAYLAKSVKQETDPFVSLNGALSESGAFLYLPPHTVLEKPLLVLNLIDAEDSAILLSPRVQIFVGAQSRIDITVMNKHLSGKTYFSNQHLDVIIEEGSHVTVNQIILGSPSTSWTFDALRATLKRDSTFRTVAVTDGAATVRSDYHVQLTGENSEASLNGLWMLHNSKESHTNVLIDHQAPHCRSMQLFKGILNDASTSSFEGKILVRQAAQKTDAFQLNNNLLLSDRANADSKPNLEIFADDVKASHGATVGQLDKEQLFYLQARGFSREQARGILVKGYCKEVIEQIKDRFLKEMVEEKVIQK